MGRPGATRLEAGRPWMSRTTSRMAKKAMMNGKSVTASDRAGAMPMMAPLVRLTSVAGLPSAPTYSTATANGTPPMNKVAMAISARPST